MTVFVSVDPGRDTSSVLKSYLAYFHMNSIGPTGTKEEIDAVVHQYGAAPRLRAQAVRITFAIHS
jgi:cytochrome oxidase Cu insertion factor (SCO1/SenC/PrrC family)